MRLLVYGFKPYGGYAVNITEQLLQRLPHRAGLITRVFDVRFDAAMFNTTLSHTRPDRILGLGQHPRARKLRIERKAKNLRMNPDRSLVPISRTGPQAYYATLGLPQTGRTTVTYDAGTYVCNYSMYLTAQYCALTGGRFGFIHVPKDYAIGKASGYLGSVIGQMLQDD